MFPILTSQLTARATPRSSRRPLLVCGIVATASSLFLGVESAEAQRRPRTGPVPLAPGALSPGPITVSPAPPPFQPGPFVPVDPLNPNYFPPVSGAQAQAAPPLTPIPDPSVPTRAEMRRARRGPLPLENNPQGFGAPPPSGPNAPQPIDLGPANAAPVGPFDTAVPVAASGPAWQFLDRYNLQLIVAERFLNRFVANERVEPGEIQDYILGAQVSGRQMTTSRLQLDLVPGTDFAAGKFVLRGHVDSRTTGVTEQAIVDTAARQEFVAVKDVQFDGRHFATRHAQVFVRAENQTLNAQTPLTGTLFGNLANRIAYRVAENRRPQAEAIARQRVADRLYPKFDGEIDQRLGDANQVLTGQLRSKLENTGLQPSSLKLCSSDTYLQMGIALSQADEPVNTPAPSLDLVDGAPLMAVLFHQDLFDALLRKADFRGFRTTSSQLRALASRFAHLFPGKVDDLDGPIAGLRDVDVEILFDEHEPLAIEVTDNAVNVTFRGTFKPSGQDFLPPVEVTIPLMLDDDGSHFLLKSGASTVRVTGNSPGLSAATVEKLAQQAIDSSLPPVRLAKQLPAEIWTIDASAPYVRSVTSRAGWLAVILDDYAGVAPASTSKPPVTSEPTLVPAGEPEPPRLPPLEIPPQ